VANPSTQLPTPAIDRWSARFKDPGLERAYRRHAIEVSGTTDQLLMISGALIHLCYGFLDWMTLGAEAPFTIALRLIGFFLILALWVLTYTPRGRANMMWIAIVISAIVAASIAVMIDVVGTVSPPYYVGLIHLAVTFSAVARISFRACSGLLAFMIGTFVYAVQDFGHSVDLIAGQAFVIGTLVSCAMGNYFLEYTRRTEYIVFRDRERYYAQVSELLDASKRSVERKNALLNVLGHVVKTPLHQIIGYAQVIEQTRQVQDDPKTTAEFAQEIHRAGTVLAHQSQRILDYSRADAGLLGAQWQVSNPTRLVREAIYRHEERAREKRIAIEVDCEALPVRVDPRHITRALDELIDNAIRYCSPGAHIRIWTEDAPSGPHLYIRDDGPGIGESSFYLIDDAFNRIDDFRKHGGDKLGIGVSLARTLLRIGGARLYFASVPDFGTQAEIVFDTPAEATAAAPAELKRAS
jgi:signal transduction histidine kinase